MNKPLAVLLLHVAGAAGQPDKAYVDRLFTAAGSGTGNLVDYLLDMSHGKVDIANSVVFDWIDYNHTPQDVANAWNEAKAEQKKLLLAAGTAEAEAEQQASTHANAVARGKIIEWAHRAAAANHFSLEGYAAVVCVFDQSIDYFGRHGHAVLGWNPPHESFSLDLTGVAHEVGHALGLASHSRLANDAAEYGDAWDIMSVYDGVHRSTGQPPELPFYGFGPGLNAVNMELADWLEQARVCVVGGNTSQATIKLRPLHRRDLPGWLAARVETVLGTYTLELRLPQRWDAAIPAACVLLHRHAIHPGDGRPCSELLLAQPDALPPRPDLREGETCILGDTADPFAARVRFRVVRIDVENAEATIELSSRAQRPIEPQATPYGAVTTDGGGWIWTPGRGFVKVPPRSPLQPVLHALADYESLHSLAAPGRADLVEQLALDRLSSARDRLSAIIQARRQALVPAQPSLRGSTGFTPPGPEGLS